jgi:hypothetical protein
LKEIVSDRERNTEGERRGEWERERDGTLREEGYSNE